MRRGCRARANRGRHAEDRAVPSIAASKQRGEGSEVFTPSPLSQLLRTAVPVSVHANDKSAVGSQLCCSSAPLPASDLLLTRQFFKYSNETDGC
ncbi:hypothetical protein WR25_06229 [Diploscapter pachys]|uniref:Uncharacterized protein n=1 Tax=Diploscapter pachys TaxID=2018661 RepID=A0A2A2M0I0_9BILA|nr:hypothetical protein WR25_06229 [Diploscapter pachys]